MNVEILTITDKSGSMNSIRGDVIGGYNRFLADQRSLPGEARLTNVQFDGAYELLFEAKPLAEAPELTPETFIPSGSTALLDAIGRTLQEQGKRIAAENWAAKVIVYIITDGGENCSSRFAHEEIKTMIEHAQEHGWSFIFLAANQDAFTVGASYGISGANTANFTASSAGTREAYATASAMTTSLRSGT